MIFCTPSGLIHVTKGDMYITITNAKSMSFKMFIMSCEDDSHLVPRTLLTPVSRKHNHRREEK